MNDLLSDVYLFTGWPPYGWYAALVLASLLDAATTAYALRSKKGRERNRAMVWAMGKVGLWPALLLLKLPQLVIVYGSLQVNILYVPLWVGVYLGIVAWNLSVIYRARA